MNSLCPSKNDAAWFSSPTWNKWVMEETGKRIQWSEIKYHPNNQYKRFLHLEPRFRRTAKVNPKYMWHSEEGSEMNSLGCLSRSLKMKCEKSLPLNKKLKVMCIMSKYATWTMETDTEIISGETVTPQQFFFRRKKRTCFIHDTDFIPLCECTHVRASLCNRN